MTRPFTTRVDGRPLWLLFAVVFPLIVWAPAYDSFHEPKWFFLMAWTGLLLAIACWNGVSIRQPRIPLDTPILACLAATLFAWRWRAPDWDVTLALWLRLPLGYLVFRLLIASFGSRTREESVRQAGHLLGAFAVGGALVGALAILQDWGIFRWGAEPVSDWRFHLSSTLGNPNEVGGYLVYLLPVVLARWWASGASRFARIAWAGVGMIFLYALTTVFTVGAWLGLFVMLPLAAAFFPTGGELRPWRRAAAAYSISAGLFVLLRALLSESLASASRILIFTVGASALLALVAFAVRSKVQRGITLAALGALLFVWGTLLLPWGIPNHPEGLVREALDSPRWKGGFGARRFIWRTTGLMVKDHPLRGIGYGRYYNLHNLYQGEVYRQRDHPHDRPSVGLVPQAHSDPLQILAETGALGMLTFAWLVASAIWLGIRRPHGHSPPLAAHSPMVWAAWTCLLLILFHSLVDFPLRQPQPSFLAIGCLAILSATRARGSAPAAPMRFGQRLLTGILAAGLVSAGSVGLRDQQRLKFGFEEYRRGLSAAEPARASASLSLAAEALDSIRYPLLETHDALLYRASVALAQNDLETALVQLRMAGNYRHGIALFDGWEEYGRLARDPRVTLGAVEGKLLYNPCWAGYLEEAARLNRLLGRHEDAARLTERAERFRVPEKPMP
ncbi:MAG: O-antigen ligase family protein [Candidatus Omnitrophica bacterium]|nr:hypothetical protein [bacterium]NUN97914.1 O-antigen ligase family protein [Candidatus Omnitrophota bacterium]